MLCLKAEALGHEMYASHGVVLPVNLGSSIQKVMRRRGRRAGGGSRASDLSSSPSGGGSASCSGPEDDKSDDSGGGSEKSAKMCCYRSQLEQEVQKLQKQLQEEIDLHVALANAVAHNAAPLLNSPSKLPDKAQELLANIAALEITVSKLEEELVALHIRLYHERNERRLAETQLECLPSLSLEQTCSSSGHTWEEHIASLRVSKFGGSQKSHSPQQDILSGHGDQQLIPVSRLSGKYPEEEIMASCSRSKEGKENNGSLQPSDAMDLQPSDAMDLQLSDAMDAKKKIVKKTHLPNPNQLSEDMVRCMRNIFLCLSETSNIPLYASSECLPSPSSPVGHLSRSSLTSFSDSSLMPSVLRSPSAELQRNYEVMDQANMFDPYRVNGKVNWRNIGSYGLAAEVSWMSVGKRQLEYAAEALKKFRFFVEQLAEVNPVRLSHNEKLAFWINLYNALIMHAYLAYGVPRSDIKLFSLMQKVSYTIGSQSFSAADIEFVILKMKPPVYRPQLALILALHKSKTSEEHRKYSINSPEPLAVFALSCGMYSSPAVRIFTADNVHAELQESMRDYIRASIGLSDKGKLLVPKLLHCFAKGVVEDSLLIDWICRYLTPDQVTVVRDSASQWKQRLLGVRSFSLIPFDSRFRYLFLPESKSFQSSSKGGSV